MCTYIVQILERKAPCQQDADLVEEATPATGELSEVESSVISAASDLVGTLATALGADFVTAFGQFLPLMLRYVDPAFSSSDRANTVGALAEIANGLGRAGTRYTDALLGAASNSVGDPDPEVRSNAAYLLGSVVFWTEADLGPQYLAMLGRLQPLFTVADDAQREKNELARDNAAGAVARMIIRDKDALPLDQVLPVFFGALPLRRDTAEYPKCFEAVYGLVERHDPTTQAHFGHILDVFAHVLAPPVPPEEDEKLSAETRARLVDFLRVRPPSRVPSVVWGTELTATSRPSTNRRPTSWPERA